MTTSSSSNVALWTSPPRAPGSHTCTLRVTGTRNVNARDSWVVPDRVDIVGS